MLDKIPSATHLSSFCVLHVLKFSKASNNVTPSHINTHTHCFVCLFCSGTGYDSGSDSGSGSGSGSGSDSVLF